MGSEQVPFDAGDPVGRSHARLHEFGADGVDAVAQTLVRSADFGAQILALVARQAAEDDANANQRCRQDEVGDQIRSHGVARLP
ncbi:MAG: hypothetical protein F4143_10635 [Gemmatimonadales bacterium]|nr:hypothetical protein [Gemmatimonadales bacterium]